MPTRVRSEPSADRQLVADELLSAMSSVRRATRRLGRRPAALSSLTGAQLELVRLVRRRPGISVAEAAAELRLAPNTVSTLVGQLTDAGLASRTVDPDDRRVARLDLSPSMRRQVDAWRDRRVLSVSTAMSRLSPDDERALRQVLGALDRLAEALGDEDVARELEATSR